TFPSTHSATDPLWIIDAKLNELTDAQHKTVGGGGFPARDRHLYVTSREIQRERRHTPHGYSGRSPEERVPLAHVPASSSPASVRRRGEGGRQ
ncbi:unnamed protein product, partial [Ixodes persulcatus]